MGYNVDQYGSQRGGYGPGSMDPYSMQGYQAGMSGFSTGDDDQQHGKGKSKGGSSRSSFGNNPNMQQFQQAPQQGAQSQQQSFGLQGGVSDASHAPGTTNAGGWSNPSWGGPSWQGT